MDPNRLRLHHWRYDIINAGLCYVSTLPEAV